MPPAPVEVTWEVAHDEAFLKVVRKGQHVAVPQWAHSVHVEVRGLESGRWYWYRFHAGGAVSPAGRARTAPAADAATNRLRFAFASCQHYEQGYFAAYRHMAAEDLDLVCHLGDYIYESSWGRTHVRSHDAPEPATLAEYRNRHALYRTDRDLQDAHAAFPWVMIWDDHEVQNDYADDRSQRLDDPQAFLARRAAAYQAYYEHMPLPSWALPQGPAMRIYTRFGYGKLAQFHLLDGRQYRSHQVCPRPDRGGSNVVLSHECPELRDPRRSLLGMQQERWLEESLTQSGGRWNIIAQQTLMAQADRLPGEGQQFWTDGWDGYPMARERLLTHIANHRPSNPVVIGGDVHMAVVADLKVNFDDPASPVVASEFVGTSISSQGPAQARLEAVRAENPHIKFGNSSRRGYTSMEITPQRCTANMRVISSVTDPRATLRTMARFAVEDGVPGARWA